MPLTRTIMGLRPPPRFLSPSTPWTDWRISESDLEDGTFTVRETSPLLPPLDADPTKPIARNITTVQATLVEGWYKVEFLDAAGNFTEPSAAIWGSTLVPLALDVRDWSLVPFDEIGFGIREDNSDPLERLVAVQARWVQRVTGLTFSNTLEQADLETMQEAVKMATEYAAYRADPDHIEGASDFDLIKRFTAGSYSEERRDLGASRGVVHPWPELDALLRGLGASTGAGGFPSVGAADVDWERQRYIIDAGKPPWLYPPVGTHGWM